MTYHFMVVKNTTPASVYIGDEGKGEIAYCGVVLIVAERIVCLRFLIATCPERSRIVDACALCQTSTHSPLGRVPPCVSEGGRAVALCASRGMSLPTRAENASTQHEYTTRTQHRWLTKGKHPPATSQTHSTSPFAHPQSTRPKGE
jgi:hypothetical protein